jgi:outer membrane lipoprotein carrier protein
MTSEKRQCGARSAECGILQAGFLSGLALLAILFLDVMGHASAAAETTPAASGPAVTAAAAESAPVVTAAVATSPAATAQAGAPVDAVHAVEAHYRDLVDLTAKVIQRNFLKSVEKTQTFEGTLSIKKPGKLRLEYTNGQVIVVDGKEAWFYSKKSNQAIRRTFKDFEQANIPVAFLLGAGAIRQEFEVSLPDADNPRTLDLVPRKAGAAMKKLRLATEESGRIIRMTVYDRSGNTSDAVFSDVKEGVGLGDAPFRFKVPKGTEIIEQ